MDSRQKLAHNTENKYKFKNEDIQFTKTTFFFYFKDIFVTGGHYFNEKVTKQENENVEKACF